MHSQRTKEAGNRTGIVHRWMMRAIASLLLALAPTLVWAEISFNGQTRFIVPATKTRTTLEIVSHEDRDNLVQVDLSWGDERADELPMVVTQPLLLIHAREHGTVDILYAGEGLPGDRESFFLLNVLEVPAAVNAPNVLQIAPRHRMKLFFRPELSSSVQDAVAGLTWRLDARDAPPSLQVENPSPYYLTLTDLQAFDASGQACGPTREHLMLAPFSAQNPELLACAGATDRVDFQIISDGGTPHPRRARPRPGADVRSLPLH